MDRRKSYKKPKLAVHGDIIVITKGEDEPIPDGGGGIGGHAS